ncbi:RDD family protein [Muricauda sp. SCSIO 64092]|uniref:RDD family protein n=1 Tax=Allomuricauda sp. SCSIO 64092 TaxID=2908842 RepID=UPI001FF646D6|nr:RDD family protein [Muricauda sp. SCSIO 64092]UOY08637.1 RDD family protein [Muricauda sp. SCSIO 64092]
MEKNIARRCIAFYLDLVVVSIIALLYLFIFDDKGPFDDSTNYTWDVDRVWFFQLGAYLNYFFFFEYFFGYTIGKRVFRFEAIPQKNGKNMVLRVVFRTILRLIPINPFSYLFDKRRLFWHELWPNIYTLKKDEEN